MRAVKMTYYLIDMPNAVNLKFIDYCCFSDVFFWNKKAFITHLSRLYRYRQSTFYWHKRAVQAQLAHHHISVQQIQIYLAFCGQNTYGQRKVQA